MSLYCNTENRQLRLQNVSISSPFPLLLFGMAVLNPAAKHQVEDHGRALHVANTVSMPDGVLMHR